MSHQFFEHYALLGLKPGAGWRELKAAYRAQMRTWHPDRFHADPDARLRAEEQTKAINRAYDELEDFYRQHATLPLSALETTSENRSTPTDTARSSVPRHDPTPAYPNWHNLVPRARYWGAAMVIAGAWLFFQTVATTSKSPAPDYVAPATIPDGVIGSPTPVDNPPSSFTYGSAMGEVYSAQGVPSHTAPDVWHYGTSRIYFHNGVVVRWEESPDHPLKARLASDSSSSRQSTLFARGSTKAEVRSIQGNPIRESDRMWDYGVSRVYFEGDRVTDWYESPLDPLKVKR